jgi:cell division septum initiation protein DivIVA
LKDYPALVRWQTQLLYMELTETPSFVKAESGFQDISQSFVRLANVSETLPQDVREQVQIALDDVIDDQPEIRETLDQARETVNTANEALERAQQLGETIERSIDAATRAGEAWQATAEAATETIKQVHAFRRPPTRREAAGLGEGEAAVDEGDATWERRRFDIREYTQTAEALSATAVQFRDLLAEARTLLEGETVEQNVARVNSLTAAALSQTAAETSGLINLATWRAVQLCGLIFVLAIAYRALMHRLIRA